MRNSDPVIVTATRAEKEQAFSNQADDFFEFASAAAGLQQVLARFCATPLICCLVSCSQVNLYYTPLTIQWLVSSLSAAAF